ncbi:MAG: hypothetical protein K6B64_03760, partial [Acholeplasmatales bacterium]|nr:hypothetical protein [Acholeplasmatales bacterium]
MEIIYSKFTVNRKKEFQIETKILKDGSNKYIFKRGVYSKEHILNTINNAKLLKTIYKDYIEIPKEYEDGVLSPFYEGN